ncbi:TIR-like protein FxsC [Streptomyces sp. NPDC050485]|uniref:TIR-like protein FxsC n=1 Tax=Streptomyces sp. NPDC050485 TaxID=3365617 RepID=UPI0037ABB475
MSAPSPSASAHGAVLGALEWALLRRNAAAIPIERLPSLCWARSWKLTGNSGGRVPASAQPGPAGQPRPYFFLSYAHTPRFTAGGPDPDMWVERFFRDLCDHVMALTSWPAGVPAGFMDREIRSGEGWSERLGEALAYCRVFVPLFSPRYFASEKCGKEWYAFEQRTIHQRAATNEPAEAIVPVRWVPVPPQELPGSAARLQLDHGAFKDGHYTYSLHELMTLRVFAEEYERAVYELAKRIVSVANATRVAPGRHIDYRTAPSAFGSPHEGPRPMHVTVAAPTLHDLPDGRDRSYYGDSPLDWNPYHPAAARPLALVAEDIVRSLNYQATVSSFDEEVLHLDGEQPPNRPEVLIVDRWALDDPFRRARLAAFEAEHRPWVSLVVPWNGDDQQSRAAEEVLTAQLEETMPSKMRQESAANWAAVRGVPSMEAFAQLLPQVVEAAAQQYLRHAAVYPTAVRPAAFRQPNRRPAAGPARPTGGSAKPPAAAAPLRARNMALPAASASSRCRAHVTLLDDDPYVGTPVRLTVELVAESAHPWARRDARPVLDVVAVPLSGAEVAPATVLYGPGNTASAQFRITAAEPGRHRIRFTFLHHDTGVVLQQVETALDIAGPGPASVGKGWAGPHRGRS